MAAPALAVVWPIIQQAGLTALVSLGILSQTQVDDLTNVFGTSTPTWEQLQANKSAFDAALSGNTISDDTINKWSEKIGGLTAQEKEMLKLSPAELQAFVDSKYKPESQRQFAADILRDQGYEIDFTEDAQGFQIATINAPEADSASLLEEATGLGWQAVIDPANADMEALQPYIDQGIYTQDENGLYYLNPQTAIDASNYANTEPSVFSEDPRLAQPAGALPAARPESVPATDPRVGVQPGALPAAPPPSVFSPDPRTAMQPGALPVAPSSLFSPSPTANMAPGALPAARPESVISQDPRVAAQPGALPAAAPASVFAPNPTANIDPGQLPARPPSVSGGDPRVSLPVGSLPTQTGLLTYLIL